VLLSANLPNGFSGVYREYALKTELDMYLLNGWVALFQFTLGIFFWPVAYLLQSQQGIDGILTNMRDGCLCLFSQSSTNTSDKCHLVILIVLAEITINIIFNLLITIVIQKGSALLLFISLTVAVPISFFLFDIPAIANMQSGPIPEHVFTVWSILGLVLTVVGLIVYNLVPETQTSEERPGSGNIEEDFSGPLSTQPININENSEGQPLISQTPPTTIRSTTSTPIIIAGSWRNPSMVSSSFTPKNSLSATPNLSRSYKDLQDY